jgi:carbamoyl-phosphate synthase large subunit
VDVDCVSDGENVVIAGIMEHMERPAFTPAIRGCVLPLALEDEIVEEIQTLHRAHRQRCASSAC